MIKAEERSTSRQQIARVIALLSIAPFFVKNILLVIRLGDKGFSTRFDWPSDMYALIFEGILCAVLSGVLLFVSRWLMGEWPKTIILILGTLLTIEIIQVASTMVTIINLKECGYPLCSMASR